MPWPISCPYIVWHCRPSHREESLVKPIYMTCSLVPAANYLQPNQISPVTWKRLRHALFNMAAININCAVQKSIESEWIHGLCNFEIWTNRSNNQYFIWQWCVYVHRDLDRSARVLTCTTQSHHDVSTASTFHLYESCI